MCIELSKNLAARTSSEESIANRYRRDPPIFSTAWPSVTAIEDSTPNHEI